MKDSRRQRYRQPRHRFEEPTDAIGRGVSAGDDAVALAPPDIPRGAVATVASLFRRRTSGGMSGISSVIGIAASSRMP
jgi:hypothetical protein